MAKLTRPISIAKVADALGHSRRNKVGILCRSSNINIYSKYKPYGMTGDWRPLPEGAIQSINYGMKPQAVVFPDHEGNGGSYPMWSQWRVPQRGEYARLHDFDHYNHQAVHPFRQAYIKSCAEDFRTGREAYPAGVFHRPIVDAEGRGKGWLRGVVELDANSDFRYTDFVGLAIEDDGDGNVALNHLYLTLAVVAIEGSDGGAVASSRPCIVAQASTPFGSQSGGGSVMLAWPYATPDGGVLMDGFNLRDFLSGADGQIRYNLYLMLCRRLMAGPSLTAWRSDRDTEVFTGNTLAFAGKKCLTLNLFPGDSGLSRPWYYPFMQAQGLATLSPVQGDEGYVPGAGVTQYNVIEGRLTGTYGQVAVASGAVLSWESGPVYASFNSATSENDISVCVMARITVMKENGTVIYSDSRQASAALAERDKEYPVLPHQTVTQRLGGVAPGDRITVVTAIYAMSDDSSNDDNTYGWLRDTGPDGDSHPGYWLLGQSEDHFDITGTIAPDGGLQPIA